MARPPPFELSDDRVRAMFLRAGFNVLVTEDVNAFAKLMQSLFLEYEQHQRRRDTKRTVYIAVGVAAFTTALPILLHYLKVM